MNEPLWDRCLSQLESELSDSDLNTWVRPLQAYRNGASLCILAPNRFVRDMVESSFLPRIREVALAIGSPENITVQLNIGTDSIPAMGNGARGPVGQHAPEHSQIAESVAPSRTVTGLDPTYTFDNLIEGKSNQLGRAAALQIAGNPGQSYNPFVVYGASGLGKTHLMQAIGHGILAQRPDARVRYLHAETYVRQMVAALQGGTINRFKDRYRDVDALLIDDIQFFSKKEQSQEEFFHNFNALFECGKQVVLTCDCYPKELEDVGERLKTRFGWGLTVSVQPPELEMRVAILQSKAARAGLNLPHATSFFIAQRIQSNVRELEGALSRVMAEAQLTHAELTPELARSALSDLLNVQARLVTIENIQKTVAAYYKIRQTDLSGRSRARSFARPRQMAMSLAKALTSKSLPEIGKAFGDRDHTTVLHACRQIDKLCSEDPVLNEDRQNLVRTLTA